MELRGMLRRTAGTGAVLAAVGAALIAPASATAAPATQDDVTAAAVVRILHASTRACLDSNSEGRVYTLSCNGNNNQRWDNFTPGKFRNVATGLCLAGSNGGSIYTTSICTNTATSWTTDGTSPTKIHHVPTGQCLNGPGGSPQAVGLDPCGSSTRWSILAG
ncbi:RICIN domain-containing protein [Lentzea flaviverrucosa]|uniref:Ricin-type beta-trefoil lectin domain-containing protein n=1 Tax=Lentzea flaviverrucosa TaxID=200379 RepID=A0A1H9WAA8_9PSEU|nr:ricin-type beta-trefoil lectin domain protein [Lentzea flaviverrucosa]RDI22253.1 ricin-type beta-trefoil lectin protein [Lentzea flaviverrucosa]SES30840.1 Ricin-type beta-trefoil lectin domain-containing protein [Lentzea flaviverrucosa]